MKYDASFFLRLGLAFAFIYAAASAFFDPEAWIGYIPDLVGNSITKGYFLLVHDIVGISLGLWLLSGKKTFYAAVAASVLLAGIVLTNLAAFVLIFRDVGLFFAAVALALLSKKEAH